MNYVAPNFRERLKSLDIARFYAMILVYYGHIVEQVMYLGSSQAALQYKFIYSFHMPLFFVIAGTVVSEKRLALPPKTFLKVTLSARLLPYVLFSILLALASLFLQGWFPLVQLQDVGAYLEAATATLLGFPAFCIPLWFMALLISVEMFHYLVFRRITASSHLVLLAAALYVAGYSLNAAYFFVGENVIFWFFNEVPVVYGFYITGILLRRHGWLEKEFSRWLSGGAALLLLMIVLATFDLNQGPFRIIEAVVIVLSGHGNIVLFPFTALAGSIMVICAAYASPRWRWLTFMGENSLSLFCLNGVFYHFVNPSTAAWFGERFLLTGGSVFFYSAALTITSLILCVPAVFVLKRYFPQFMGKPNRRSPLFGPLLRET